MSDYLNNSMPKFEIVSLKSNYSLSFSYDRSSILSGVPFIGSSTSGSSDQEFKRNMADADAATKALQGKVIQDDRVPTLPEFNAMAKTLHAAVAACRLR